MAFRTRNPTDCVRLNDGEGGELSRNKIQHLASRQKPLKFDVLFVSLFKVLEPEWKIQVKANRDAEWSLKSAS